MVELGQMTLQVGGEELDDVPPTGTFSIGGKLAAAGELAKGAQVIVTVSDADGQVVAHGLGTVGALTFRQKEKDGLRWTERQHRVKVDA